MDEKKGSVFVSQAFVRHGNGRWTSQDLQAKRHQLINILRAHLQISIIKHALVTYWLSKYLKLQVIGFPL